jgi:hypothetical protein
MKYESSLKIKQAVLIGSTIFYETYYRRMIDKQRNENPA